MYNKIVVFNAIDNLEYLMEIIESDVNLKNYIKDILNIIVFSKHEEADTIDMLKDYLKELNLCYYKIDEYINLFSNIILNINFDIINIVRENITTEYVIGNTFKCMNNRGVAMVDIIKRIDDAVVYNESRQ